MASRSSLAVLALACVVASVLADTYMHNPRGSNNRLNERSANRNNGNRMFDSQNNNRGGYNKGDKFDDTAFSDYDEQYDFFYYMSENNDKATGKTILSVEWTNQHGCGGNEHGDPHKLNCNILLQYQCQPEMDDVGNPLVERTRQDCEHECMKPHPQNPECKWDGPPCTRVPAVLDAQSCNRMGNVWSNETIDDEYNCPHRCTNPANAKSKAACSGTWGEHTNGDNGVWLNPRDGLNTNRQEFTNANNNQFTAAQPEAQRFNRKDGDVVRTRGLHEPWEWYDECYRRERNRGLFTADQNLRNNNLGYSSAVYTRQNPNNNRRGYECPEERDYWPYWHPSAWRDIVVMTDRLDLCDFFRAESQNKKPKALCRNTETCGNCIRYNQQKKCEDNGGRWAWDGAHDIPLPECIQAPWSRVNHNGNGRHGQHNQYNWTLPYLEIAPGKPVPHRCVLRLRYNISTDDYDAWKVNNSFNDNRGQGVLSPVRQNPNVDMGAENQALRLAINTAQFGRTFQDRSHVFRLLPRPVAKTDSVFSGADRDLMKYRPRADVSSNDNVFAGRTVYNLNVRGKRGNIVQTYPSVEYDFVPNQLHVTEQDLVHFQWTGSNTHNNGNPAGDGQAGDAGEGRGGTDRHNVVELDLWDMASSFPMPAERGALFNRMLDAFPADHNNLFGETGQADNRVNDFLTEDFEAVTEMLAERGITDPTQAQLEEVYPLAWEEVKARWQLRMASAGYYSSFDGTGENSMAKREQRNEQLNNLLNNANPSFKGGLFRFKRGEYNYMCTRNHNFSNRDQKGTLIVA
eukprot:m.123467 g.123467  ORF g.123467 m.123467 type:complete len:798 (-) comp16588_c0_seq2:470-2863(-)